MIKVLYNQYVKVGYTVLVLLFVLSIPSMSPVFTIPYLTADSSIFLSGVWTYCLEDLHIAESLNVWELYLLDPVIDCEETVRYNLNNPFYVLLGFISKQIFPFLGPIGAIILLQLFVHGISCLSLYKNVSVFSKNTHLFYYLYVSNPLVLLIVTMPFYYFWAFLASFVLIIVRERSMHGLQYQILLILLLIVGFFSRQTSLALILFFYAYTLRTYKRKAIVLVLFSIPLFYLVKSAPFMSSGKGNQVGGGLPIHQFYIGVGAYPNPFGIDHLTDNEGLDKYNHLTGQSINTSPLHSDWSYNDSLRADYNVVMLNEVKNMFETHPGLYLRNSVLNFFAGYSVGYIASLPFWLHLFISMTGFLFSIILLYKRLYFELLTIAISHIVFTPYFPPVPVYMFSTYILLVYALLKLINLWK